MMSYSEISDKASCSKQTVINRIKSLGWTEHIQMIGQKAMVPHSISQYLIAVIQDHPVRPEILESLRLDGYHFDGLDGYHTPSNTVKQPSNEPSNTVKQPSNDDTETPHEDFQSPYINSQRKSGHFERGTEQQDLFYRD